MRIFRSRWCLLVLLPLLASPRIALADDCFCSSAKDAYRCHQDCEQAKETKRVRGDVRVSLDSEAKSLLPAFKSARDRLHKTDPSGSDFAAAFREYQTLRQKRDSLVLREYGFHANVLSFFTNGAEFQAVDDLYLVPEKARRALHDYAFAQLKQVLNAGTVATGGRPQRTGISGSYETYARIADQEEVKVWSDKHGVPPPKLDVAGAAVKPGSGIDWKSPEKKARIQVCHARYYERYGRGSKDPAALQFYRACTHSTD